MKPQDAYDTLDPRFLYNITASLPGLVYQFAVNTQTGEHSLHFIGPQLKTLLGLDPDQPDLFERLIEALDEADRERFAKSNQEAIARGSEWRFEGRFHTPSGELRWFEARSTPSRQGELLYFNGMIHDTTDIRQAEETLRLYFEQSVVAIILVGEDGSILAWNQASADLTGIRREEILGQPYWEMLWRITTGEKTAERRERIEAVIRHALASGNSEALGSTQMEFRRLDGQTIYVEQTTFPIRTSRGWRFGVIARNITQRYYTELALRERENDLARAQAIARLGNWSLDPATGVVRWSDEVYRLFGVDKETFIPSTDRIAMLIHPEDRELHNSAVLSAMNGHTVPPFDMRVVRPSGEERIMLASGFDIEVDAAGKLHRIYGVVLDVTEQRESEILRQRLENQLLQAMKMDAIGRLAGGVAHDFNNLLTGILGNAELLAFESNLNPKARESLEQIKKAGESAAALTRQLLAFSRQQIIEPKVIDVDQLISSLIKLLPRLISEEIQLRYVPGQGLWRIKIDPGQFEQILINLAVNARDAMPQGGLLLIETKNVELDEQYARKHAYAQPGPHVMVSVSDTGSGMSAEVRSRIFEPFYTTKPQGRGTGLGLATTYGAVKQAQGAIDVYSEEGQGTTFKLYFPRTEEQVEAPSSHANDFEQELPGGDETVLLVEDDPIVREVATSILSHLGYNLFIAPNGFEAIALATQTHKTIDLLLTDVVMPGMNGRQLAETLNRLNPHMRVLYTSGYTENVIVHRGVLDEGLSFISKPYTPQSLALKLRELLDA